MSDRMPEDMPEDMPDRMPEDVPVRTCINVMVGITRSKVIFSKNWIDDHPRIKKHTNDHGDANLY